MPTFATFRPLALALVAAALGLCAGGARAEPLTDEKVDQAVEGALGGWNSFPWYDAAQHEAQAVPTALQPPPPPPDLSQIRVAAPPAPSAPRTGGTSWAWLTDLWGFLLANAPWILLIIVAIALALLLARAYVLRFNIPPAETKKARLEKPLGRTEMERLENLPVPVTRSQHDLLGEARRQYEAGNYDEAIIYLFSYELVELDRHQKLRLERGKTNRQYLREVRSHANLANILRGTMYCFEDVFFGHHPLGRVEFEACWRRLDEFQREAAAT